MIAPGNPPVKHFCPSRSKIFYTGTEGKLPAILRCAEKKFLTEKQKYLTDGKTGAIMCLSILHGKCVGAKRVVWRKVTENCRVVRGKSRVSDEVLFASSVLKDSVGTTGATVTSLRLLRPSKDPAARRDRKQSGTACIHVPVYQGRFLFSILHCKAAKSIRHIL